LAQQALQRLKESTRCHRRSLLLLPLPAGRCGCRADFHRSS
jgi:hypothetical protein